VGADLGGKVVVIHPTYDALVVSAAEAPPRRKSAEDGARGSAKGKGAKPASPEPRAGPAALPVALRELGRVSTGHGTRRFDFGAGVRDGAPVVIALDVSGAAVLAPIDPALGTLGAEEPLAPLTALSLGSDASCAAPRPGEAKVVLPLDTPIGLDRKAMRGVI